MLQPRTYPTLLARALVLEPEPFEVLAEDDAPATEGAFLVLLVGLLVAAVHIVGGLLFSWAMPPAAALDAIANQAAGTLERDGWPDAARLLLEGEPVARYLAGYDFGWLRLLDLLWRPFLLLALWLTAGLLLYLIGRALGGRGRVGSVLGAAALSVAPSLLLVATLAPFVTVNPLLLATWGLLLLYRAAQVAHGLPWRRAATAAVLSAALVGVAVTALASLGGTFLWAL